MTMIKDNNDTYFNLTDSRIIISMYMSQISTANYIFFPNIQLATTIVIQLFE